MTTALTKAVRRETGTTVYSGGKARRIVVELRPGVGVGFRLKGTRTTYYLPVEGLYRQAVRAEIARRKAERAKQRKERNHAT